MAELTGFSAATKLGPDLGPQSIRVPLNKGAAIAKAAELVEAFFDVVDADLTPNLTVEFLKHPETGATYCRVSPLQADGITKTVAKPGDWVAVDGSRLLAMTNREYAGKFTQDLPLDEWAATEAAPAASIDDDGKVTLTFPEPTSANRPFAYTVTRGEETVATGSLTIADDIVTLPLELTLAEGESADLAVTVTATKYGTTATSALTTVTRRAPEPEVES